MEIPRDMTRMKYERQRRRLSQQRLAKMVGLHQWHVSLMERGHLIPTDEQRKRLEATLESTDLLAQVVIVEVTQSRLSTAVLYDDVTNGGDKR
jgi:ribosome-binding protein aMBF1 (putative translation factor)